MNLNSISRCFDYIEFYKTSRYSHQKKWALSLLVLLGLSIAPAFGDASQIAGPDSNLYPDVRKAGVQGGIPTITNVLATITQGEAASNLSSAIQTAVNSATTAGVIQLPTGTYTLAQPIYINKSGIVISGTGTATTVINFTLQAPSNGTGSYFQPPSSQTTLYNNTWVEAQVCPTYQTGTATPAYLTSIQLFAGASAGTLNAVGAPYTQGLDGGAAFNADTNGGLIMAAAPHMTTCLVRCVAIYGTWTGTVTTPTGTVTVDRTFNLSDTTDPTAILPPYELAAFNFSGISDTGAAHVNIAAAGNSGDTSLSMPTGHGFNVGDMVQIHCPTTPTFNTDTGNKCTDDFFREYQFSVTGSSANSITLNQPLRIDYPIQDSLPPYVEKIHPIQNCGVQNFTLNQLYNVWTSGVYFYWAWNCWANNVVVNKSGRFPVWFSHAKWCEVNNCAYNGSWFTGGGSSAYAGFEFSFDCLMQNSITTGLRHGPLVQWSSAGDVIYNCTFTDSDAQWHAGWSNNNIFDNVTVLSNMSEPNATATSFSDFGSYGDGAYSSAPSDSLHGPNGPNNVVYNCDFSSPEHAVYMGGANQNWLILWNRFSADTGESFEFGENSTGHLISSNVFALGQTGYGMAFDGTPSTDIDFVNSLFSATFNKSITSTYTNPTGLTWPLGAPLASTTNNTYNDNLQQAIPGTTGTEAYTMLDGNFDDTTFDGWTIVGDTGLCTRQAASAYTGPYGLHIYNTLTSTTPPSATSVGFSDSGTVTPEAIVPGTTYGTRFLYRVNDGEAATSVALQFFNSSGVYLSKSTLVLKDTLGAWAPAMITAIAPATAASANVKVYVNSGFVANADLDNFEFGIVSKLANSTVSFDSGFESGGWTGWDNSADGGHSTISAEHNATTANHVVEITQGSLLTSSPFNVTVGDTYQARFTASTYSGTGVGPNVTLKFLNSSGVQIVTHTLTIPNNLADAAINPKVTWEQHVVRYEAPSDAATAEVEISSPSSAPATEDIDNVIVLDLPKRPVPVSPSVTSIYQWELSQGN